MRIMILAFVTVALISVAAHFGLDNAGFSSAERSSSSAVRLE